MPCAPASRHSSIEQGGRPVALFDGPGGTQVPDTVIEAVSRYYRESNANHEGAVPDLPAQRRDPRGCPPRAGRPAQRGGPVRDQVRRQHDDAHDPRRPLDRGVARAGRRDRRDRPRSRGERRPVARRRRATAASWSGRSTSARDDVTLDLAGPRRGCSTDGPGWSPSAGRPTPSGRSTRSPSSSGRAHAAGAWTYVDAVHAAPHLPIDVQATGTDFLACSAYKFFGPHVGVLYGRRDVLDRLPTYKLLPAYDRFETGTLNHEGIAGSLAAVEYIAEVGRRFGAAHASRFPDLTGRRLEAHAGMAAIRAYEMPLFGRLLDGLDAIPGARLWGIADRSRFEERTPTAAVTLDGVSAEAASGGPGRAGDRDLVGELLRGRPDRPARARARRSAPHRPDALQHDGGGRPPGRGAARDRGRAAWPEVAQHAAGRRDPTWRSSAAGSSARRSRRTLAGRGARVSLVERGEIAAGASGRNSGVVWAPSDPVLGALYRETLARYRALADEVRAELPGGAPERAFRLDDRPAGILLLGTDGGWLQGRAAAIGAANPEFRPAFLDGSGAPAARARPRGRPRRPCAWTSGFRSRRPPRRAPSRRWPGRAAPTSAWARPATVAFEGRRAVGVSTGDG